MADEILHRRNITVGGMKGQDKTHAARARLPTRAALPPPPRVIDTATCADTASVSAGRRVSSKSGSMTARVISPSGAALPGIPKAHFFDPVFCAMVRWSGMAAGTGGTANSRR